MSIRTRYEEFDEFQYLTTAEWKQINLFRVAFLLERMCPLAYGLGKKFNETVSGNSLNNVETITYSITVLRPLCGCHQPYYRSERCLRHP